MGSSGGGNTNEISQAPLIHTILYLNILSKSAYLLQVNNLVSSVDNVKISILSRNQLLPDDQNNIDSDYYI